MKKTIMMTVLLTFLAMIGLAGILAAADAPEKISIMDPLFGDKAKKGPVEFNHKKHSDEYKVTCAECHHNKDYDGKTNTFKQGDAIQKCSECHKMEKDGKKDKLQNAFHTNCKECHKAKGKGPEKKCNECHAEKK